MNDLMQLVGRGDDQGVRDLIDSHPDLFSQPNRLATGGGFIYFLGYALQTNTLTAKTIQQIYDASPPEASTRCFVDFAGAELSCIHVAFDQRRTARYFGNTGIPLSIIKFLIENNNNTQLLLQLPDKKERTPLHRACSPSPYEACNDEFVEYLLEKGPQAASAMDHDGSLPLHLYVRRERPSVITMRKLVKAFPEALLHTRFNNDDDDGELPICGLREPYRLELLEVLLGEGATVFRKRPGKLTELCLYGTMELESRRLMLERLCSAVDSSEYSRKYKLHSILRLPTAIQTMPYPTDQGPYRHLIDEIWPSPYYRKVLGLIMKSNPESAKTLDCNGRLPLHVVIAAIGDSGLTQGALLVHDVFLAEPRAALVRDPVSGLWPFLAAELNVKPATTMYNDDETVLRVAPAGHHNNTSESKLSLVYSLFRESPATFVSSRICLLIIDHPQYI